MSTAKANDALEAGREIELPTPESPRPESTPERPTFTERIEAYISRLSTRNNFWHKVCSLIWLPYAFRSGITMKRLETNPGTNPGTNRFSAVLPFRRFNRNWYNAMAGAALLGNSEVAGGMFLFSECGGDYIVVCKELRYRFLRPCYGPAVYHVTPNPDLAGKIATGGEFNIDLELEITQQVHSKGREPRVGRCSLTFHCTPKAMMKARELRKRERLTSLAATSTTAAAHRPPTGPTAPGTN